MLKEFFLKYFFLILVFVSGLIINIIKVDPDFGWHIRLGQDILKHGIVYHDQFSYTMPSFPFVDHEWGINVIFYLLYSLNRFLLPLIFAAVSIVLFFILTTKIKISYLFIYLLFFAVLFEFVGVRTQLVSWVFFAIVLKIVLDSKLWEKFKFYAPVIILLWANMHGSFPLGIIILSIPFLKSVKNKKNVFSESTVFLSSVIATFINPYGIGVWREALSQAGDPYLRFLISEWVPSVFYFNLSFIVWLVISIFFISLFINRISLKKRLLFILFLVTAITSIRFSPYFLIVSFLILPELFYELEKLIKKVPKGTARLKRVVAIITIFSFGIFTYSMVSNILDAWNRSEVNYYPKNAINFLRSKNYKGQVFADYNWGGYLDWKYRERKVFIDGRMPSWSWEAPNNESSYAFLEYNNIISGNRDYRKVFEKYKINIALLRKSKDKNSSLVNFLTKRFAAKKMSLRAGLEKEKWKKAYEDKVSVIYISPILQ